ncbi:hypothetical protein BKA65DRAFT_150686 [Rhexocercosporidium sp. MPI-PUGE-AT-0058]|nr:hypothetical protein BKA65DRAFT_150686 [Rhexocercosporidium sp. MPI-PUGE-AT-0058]
MGFTSYSGPASSFPPISTWLSFEDIFNASKSEMLQTGDSDEDVGRIWNAVVEAAEIGVEARVIFCIIMQESTGNVGVETPTNQDGDATGGLMQCVGSPAFPGEHDLSQDQISSMIQAGTKHFKDNLNELDGKDTASTIYRALRLYNSGELNDDDLSDGKGATDSYVSDLANRLQGRLP